MSVQEVMRRHRYAEPSGSNLTDDSWRPPEPLWGAGALLTYARPETVLRVPIAGERRLTVRLSRPEPAWLRRTMAGFAGILALERDWDSYGGRRIDDQCVRDAMGMLFRMLPANANAPFVVPRADGGLQLEWHQANQDIEICLLPSGLIQVEVERDGVESRYELHTAPDRLAEDLAST